MGDEDLGKPTIDLLRATKAIVERDLGLGFITPERLRFTIEARKETAKRLAADGKSTREIAEITGASHNTIARDLRAVSNDTEIVPNDTVQGKREAALREQLRIAQTSAVTPDHRYGTIVIDPPWPMKKIEREVRPNQVEFDYPTMSEEQLRDFRVEFERMVAADCHVFMWTTHRFLPMALRLFQEYAVKYVLTMVWHKPGGFQPVGLPQYNCEFVIYGRIGSPSFIDTKAFNCCFEASRREHSRKPDAFYELVKRVTPQGRIDVFSREKRDGFDQYGKEVDRFAEAVA